MPKQSSQSFLVVADTNALFPRDPTQIVSEGFMVAWKECLKLAKAHLVISEIVRGERLYQMVGAAQRSLANAEKNAETITGVSASVTVSLPKITEIKQATEKRFDDWAKAHGIEIVPVPCGKIDWRRVVSDAIWRVSPFMPPTEGKDTEKGFRDCLIAETLNELIQSHPGEQVVFIAKDHLLRNATIARFPSAAFAAYEDLGGLLSYLTLTREQAEKAQREFIQRVIQKAPSVFYSADDPTCAYLKFNIGSRIMQEFATQLNVLSQPETENHSLSFERSAPASEEKIYIDTTQYEQSSSKVAWGWRTRLRFLRLFRSQPEQSAVGMTSPQVDFWDRVSDLLAVNELLRVAPFDVHWTAHCDDQANFSQLKLVAVKPLPQTQEVGFFKYKYGFKPTKPA